MKTYDNKGEKSDAKLTRKFKWNLVLGRPEITLSREEVVKKIAGKTSLTEEKAEEAIRLVLTTFFEQLHEGYRITTPRGYYQLEVVSNDFGTEEFVVFYPYEDGKSLGDDQHTGETE